MPKATPTINCMNCPFAEHLPAGNGQAVNLAMKMCTESPPTPQMLPNGATMSHFPIVDATARTCWKHPGLAAEIAKIKTQFTGPIPLFGDPSIER